MSSRSFFHHIRHPFSKGLSNAGIKTDADNPLSPYGSPEEIVVANTIYNLQNSGMKPRMSSLLAATPDMDPENIRRSLFLLEGKGLISLEKGEHNEPRYAISENDGIILGRIIDANRAQIQECLNKHKSARR